MTFPPLHVRVFAIPHLNTHTQLSDSLKDLQLHRSVHIVGYYAHYQGFVAQEGQ
jgi:hypothetical protein